MTKRQVIDEILAINQTANPGFLARFDDDQLCQYLAHLNVLRQPRIPPGDPARYDRYFRNCPTVRNRPAWRTDAAQPRPAEDPVAAPTAEQAPGHRHAAAGPDSAPEAASASPAAADDAQPAPDLAPADAELAAPAPDAPAPADPGLLPLAVTAQESAEAMRGGSAPADAPGPLQPVAEIVEPAGHVSAADLMFHPAQPAEEFPIVGLGAVVSALGVVESTAYMGDMGDADAAALSGDIVQDMPLPEPAEVSGMVAGESPLADGDPLAGEGSPALSSVVGQGPSVSGPLFAAAEPQDRDSWLY